MQKFGEVNLLHLLKYTNGNAHRLDFDFLWNLTFNENIAATKFEELIQDLNMLETPLIFHAAYAGIFLFISGLIAGSVANKIKTKKNSRKD